MPSSSSRAIVCLASLVLSCFCLSAAFHAFAADAPASRPVGPGGPLDPVRVRQLMARSRAGETLSADDQAYLNWARQQIQARAAGGAGTRPATRPAAAATRPATAGKLRTDIDLAKLVPLTDMTEKYLGEDGGLYGAGRNTPPDAHAAAYRKQSEQIQPLDADGKPAADGKIGLITIGFSNTHLISMELVKEANADPRKSAKVVVMDGAIGSRSAVMWAWDGADVLPRAEQERLDKEMDLVHMPKTRRSALGDKDTWPTLEARLKDAGLTPKQVQVVWMKHVEAHPQPLGEFPAHAKALQQDMADILIIARKRFPNLRVAILASRTFSGWSGPNNGSPEPYAYESGFATRWLIQSQIAGNPDLNYDPEKGSVQAPIMIWGPYIWANGDTPRKLDGMTWGVNDVRENDHLHPSESGCKKVAGMIIQFLKTDAAARRWYLGEGGG